MNPFDYFISKANAGRNADDNVAQVNKYVTYLSNAFRDSDLPEEFTIDFFDAQVVSIGSILRSATAKTTPKVVFLNGDTSHVTDFSYAFNYRFELTDIVGDIDFSSATNTAGMFSGTKMANATFVPNTLKVNFDISAISTPSDDMLISIANCLSSTQHATLKLSATSYNKVAAIYGTVDTSTMFFTKSDVPAELLVASKETELAEYISQNNLVSLVDFISLTEEVEGVTVPVYKGWQLVH